MTRGVQLLMDEIASSKARVKELESLLGEVAPDDGVADQPVSWVEVARTRMTEPEWLWRMATASKVTGLIPPRAVGFLAADSRAGKSLFLLNLGLSAARGKPFLDCSFRTGVRVLYVAAEGARPMTFKRAREVGAGLFVPFDEDIPFFFQPDGVPHGDYVLGAGRVERWVERVKATLVILDTVGYFHDGDENDAMEVKRHIMRPLYALSDKLGCSFIVVHHHKKGAEDVDAWKKGRGSSALFDDADFWWRMETPKGDARFVWAKGTDNALQHRELHIDKNKYDEDGIGFKMVVDFRRAIFTRVPEER